MLGKVARKLRGIFVLDSFANVTMFPASIGGRLAQSTYFIYGNHHRTLEAIIVIHRKYYRRTDWWKCVEASVDTRQCGHFHRQNHRKLHYNKLNHRNFTSIYATKSHIFHLFCFKYTGLDLLNNNFPSIYFQIINISEEIYIKAC